QCTARPAVRCVAQPTPHIVACGPDPTHCVARRGAKMRLQNVQYKYLVAAAFLFGLFMDLMDLTIVNVALPTLGRRFHAGNSALEWVVTGYLLSLAIWIPASAWLGDRFGTTKTFL